MNEKELREALKLTKYGFVKITRFKLHDRVVLENADCRLSWNLRGKIENYSLPEVLNALGAGSKEIWKK
jgi:hypothetical protein